MNIGVLVVIHNTLCILGSLSACSYLTVNDHIGMAIACLCLGYLSLTNFNAKK